MNTNPQARTILCYGDSNTWGANPFKEERWPSHVRWTGVLQRILGDGWEVVEEGLCGRTFVAENPKYPHRTGITHLQSILDTHEPIDTLIVMLGTNDVTSTFNLSSKDVASHLDATLQFVEEKADESIKRTLVICPAPVAVPNSHTLDSRYEGRIHISQELSKLFEEVSKQHKALFLDAGTLFSLEDTDGYHLDEAQHKTLGVKISTILQQSNSELK